MSAQLRHPRLEAGPRPGAREEEEHRQDLVAQQGVILAEGSSSLDEAEALGVSIAEQLLTQGADAILAEIYNT